ncbi:hypothetical protein LCM4579_09355 [Ensifer sp. LCM 4579]|nr:hypothetical protein LCM4579_09355 [Ensifer sp. LCM 4579]
MRRNQRHEAGHGAIRKRDSLPKNPSGSDRHIVASVRPCFDHQGCGAALVPAEAIEGALGSADFLRGIREHRRSPHLPPPLGPAERRGRQQPVRVVADQVKPVRRGVDQPLERGIGRWGGVGEEPFEG